MSSKSCPNGTRLVNLMFDYLNAEYKRRGLGEELKRKKPADVHIEIEEGSGDNKKDEGISFSDLGRKEIFKRPNP